MPLKDRTSPLPEQILERHAEPDENCFGDDPPVSIFLPTGCTLLNCCLSNRWDGGWPGGRVSNLIGGTDTGKTYLSLACLAEASKMENFNNYSLLFVDEESSQSRSGLKRVFGQKFLDRVQILSSENEDESTHPPETVEEFHYLVIDLLNEGNPFVLILDSLDHLPSKDELEWTKKNHLAYKKGKEESGSFQMSKQKYLKKMFREISCALMKTNSIIIIISQTIANIGSIFNPISRSGGSGMDFSCRIIGWSSHLQFEKQKERIIGRQAKFKTTKNHITFSKREVKYWIYDNLGIDDIRGNIEFLLEEKIWERSGAYISPHGLFNDKKFLMKDLISVIEKENKELELSKLVGVTWLDIEEELRLKRKPRYI